MSVPLQLTGRRGSWPTPAASRLAARRLPNPMLLAALLGALGYHGGQLLAGSYQRTYDSWVHIFFGDHYRRDWWSSWDTRWYTGFTTVSYPPGTHQLVALGSHLIGLRSAFVAVQVTAILMNVVGIYRFSMLWVDKKAAGWAAVLFVASSSIAETVHVFGQLPTTFSLSMLLNSLPFAYKWIRDGHVRSGIAGVLCAAATTAGHHVTTLFGSVFFLGPTIVLALVEKFRTPLPDETPGRARAIDRQNLWPFIARRLRRVLPATMRAGVYGISVIVGLVMVVLPYWMWSKADPITQVSIPHASRDSFIVNLNAGLVFWLIPWGFFLLAFPYVLTKSLFTKAWPLVASLLLLAFLGTGGTTPFPRMLLGGAFDVLTLDRFTFWGTIVILPFAGKFASSLAGGPAFRWLADNVGRVTALCLTVTLALAVCAFSMFSANLTHYRPFQPAKVASDPIIRFIEKDEHFRWRYLMLGMGDQMAWISGQTTAGTVDGNYHSARRLPELTSTPIERLEGAKYGGVQGLGSLQQMLTVPERYHLKFVFSNDKFYDPLLAAGGWTPLGILENGVYAWERADVTPIPPALFDHQVPKWQRLMWGTLPPLAIFSAWSVMIWAFAFGFRIPKFLLRRRHKFLKLIAPLAWLYRWFDGKLAAASRRALGEGFLPRTWKFVKYRDAIQAKLAVRPTHRRRLYQRAAVLLTLAMMAGLVVVKMLPSTLPPDEQAVEYYLALDLRDFGKAYALLDEFRRPDFEIFRKDQLSDGGLVASYAKLNTARAKVRTTDGDRALVSLSLDYLTALIPYHVDTEVQMVRGKDGAWRLRLPYVPKEQPPEKFTSRTSIDYLTSQRSSASRRDGRDILDRPRLRLLNARATLVKGRWTVTGEVTNVDVDPADVTVTAQLRDADGQVLAGYNASFVMTHKLLPGEISPFRVDFEGIAGVDKASSEFNPLAVTPLELPAKSIPTTVDVYAKAVVTDYPIVHRLDLVDLRVTTDADGKHFLDGQVRNDGTAIVSIPHLLLTFRDAAGNAAWVDHVYLKSSILPQHFESFHLPLDQRYQAPPDHVRVNLWDGADITLAEVPPHPDPLLTLPTDTGFSTLDVTAVPLV